MGQLSRCPFFLKFLHGLGVLVGLHTECGRHVKCSREADQAFSNSYNGLGEYRQVQSLHFHSNGAFLNYTEPVSVPSNSKPGTPSYL
jgi:hypothetical protein